MANCPLGVTHAGADEAELVLDSLVEDVESEVLEATHDPASVVVEIWVIMIFDVSVVLSVILSVEKLSLVAVAVAVAVAVRVSTILEPDAVVVVVT
jgi:hypothetical protein